MSVTARQPQERRTGSRLYERVTVGGLRTDCVSRHQLGSLMVGDCLAARGGRRAPRLVFASNGHAVAMAAMDSEFRATFAEADLVHADGEPVVVASRLLCQSAVPERSATTDFLFDAARAAAEFGLKFFMLGSTEAINAVTSCMPVVVFERGCGSPVRGRYVFISTALYSAVRPYQSTASVFAPESSSAFAVSNS